MRGTTALRLACAVAVAGVTSTTAGAARGQGATDAEECVSAAEESQPLRTDGKLTAAREKLLVCARPGCPDFVRADCTRWLAEVENVLPSVVFRVVDDKGKDVTDVRVLVDGKVIAEKLDGRPVAVDPGEHVFTYEAPGLAPVSERLLVRQGEANRLVSVSMGPPASARAAAPPAEPPAPTEESGAKIPLASWVLGGAGLVSLGVGAVFLASGKGDHSDMESGCAKTRSCSQSEVDSAKTKLLVGDVAVGVGIVGIGAAIVLALVSKDEPAPKPAATRLEVKPVTGGAFATFGARF